MIDLLGAVLFGVALGSLVFVVSAAVISSLTEKTVSRWTDAERANFLMRHSLSSATDDGELPSACKEFSKPYAMALAFGVLGSFAHFY